MSTTWKQNFLGRELASEWAGLVERASQSACSAAPWKLCVGVQLREEQLSPLNSPINRPGRSRTVGLASFLAFDPAGWNFTAQQVNVKVKKLQNKREKKPKRNLRTSTLKHANGDCCHIGSVQGRCDENIPIVSAGRSAEQSQRQRMRL